MDFILTETDQLEKEVKLPELLEMLNQLTILRAFTEQEAEASLKTMTKKVEIRKTAGIVSVLKV